MLESIFSLKFLQNDEIEGISIRIFQTLIYVLGYFFVDIIDQYLDERVLIFTLMKIIDKMLRIQLEKIILNFQNRFKKLLFLHSIF